MSGKETLSGATSFLLLDWWAFNRTVGAKHATITRFGLKQYSSEFTFVKKQARISRHGFCYGMPAMRASECRVENYLIHFPFPLMTVG